jgi:hypothetical protein
MTQTRYHSYLRPLDSFHENSRISGIAAKGVICGFDTYLPSPSSRNFSISHLASGIKKGTKDNLTLSDPQGCVISPHGVVVYEDEAIQLTLSDNSTNSNRRVYLVIMEHQWVSSENGSPATYSLVVGPSNGSIPVIPNPERQVLIATIEQPANSTNASEAVYYRANPKLMGGNEVFSYLNDGVNLPSITPLEGRLDNITKSGLYYVGNNSNIPDRPGGNTEDRGFLMVLINGNYVHQFYLSSRSGRVYVRGGGMTNNAGNVAYTKWGSLNNVEIDSDVTELFDIIGDREYNSNLLTDGVTITASLNTLADELDTALDDIVSLQTGKADKSIEVIGDGALTGGGSLSQNRFISIKPGGVTGAMIDSKTISASNIADFSISSLNLGDFIVTHNKLGPNAVENDNIDAGAVDTGELANFAVTNTKLGDNSISNIKIQDGAVGTSKLAIGGWTTSGVSSNWTTSGSGTDEGFRYRKNVNEVVEFKGLVWRNTGTTVDFFLTLPVSYRPSGDRYLPILDYAGDPIYLFVDASTGRCTIYPIRSGAATSPSTNNGAYVETVMPL